MTSTTVKVMSLSSTSGAPTPPNPTPCVDSPASNHNATQPDLEAVYRLLDPIQEDLNEQADVAMLPSPPINTPEAFSPAPSMYRVTRSRGFSLLGDRLAQLKLHEHSSPRKDSDCASSNRSIVASLEDEGENNDNDNDANSNARSAGNWSAPKHTINKTVVPLISPTPGAIPIALGSARLNPRIEEYVQFSSKDLPVTGPVKAVTSSTQAVLAKNGSHTRGGSFDTVKSDGARSGVTEKSTWAEEVEDAAERAFLRLEQLAYDEYTINPKRSMEDHYTKRLQRLLGAGDRKVKVKVTYEGSAISSASSSATPPVVPTEVLEQDVKRALAGNTEKVTKE